MQYISDVDTSFAVIAEPNRRAILSLLLSSERSVGELERKLRLSQPSVSKHLRVLREAGFVESRTEAQQRVYRLRPEPLMELDAWLAPFRRFWSKPELEVAVSLSNWIRQTHRWLSIAFT